jgi:hypothetical protein
MVGVNNMLGPTGRLPTFPTKFPKKAVVLVQQWVNNGLNEFLRHPQGGWCHTLKMAFNKRKTCYLYVKERATTNMESFGDAAAAIDLENFEARPAGRYRTLDQWLTIQKASDPNVADRAARTIDVGVGFRRIARRQEESLSSSLEGEEDHTAATATAPAARRRPPATARAPTHGGRGRGRGGSRGRGRGDGRGRGCGGGRGRGRGGRGGDFFGRQANGLPWPDRRWRDRLTEGERQAIMRGDTGHPGWINERGITSNRRDADLEAIDEGLV